MTRDKWDKKHAKRFISLGKSWIAPWYTTTEWLEGMPETCGIWATIDIGHYLRSGVWYDIICACDRRYMLAMALCTCDKRYSSIISYTEAPKTSSNKNWRSKQAARRVQDSKTSVTENRGTKMTPKTAAATKLLGKQWVNKQKLNFWAKRGSQQLLRLWQNYCSSDSSTTTLPKGRRKAK